jgi:hypothetical protein
MHPRLVFHRPAERVIPGAQCQFQRCVAFRAGLSGVVPDHVDILGQRRSWMIVHVIPHPAADKTGGNPAIRELQFPHQAQNAHAGVIRGDERL